MKLESAIQSEVLDVLKDCGIWAQRVNSGKIPLRGRWIHLWPAGTADVVVFPPNSPPVWLETKRPKKNQETAQVEFQLRAERMGHKYYVVRSIDDIAPYIEEWR